MIEAKFYDVTDWPEISYFNTKGTRNKCVLCDPSDDETYHFFKTSINKEGKRYKPEFWSEIISSKIGQILGFNTLDYNIAFNDGHLGCISRSMIKGDETLVEGVNLLTGYNTSYKPDEKSHQSEYTFGFIKSSIRFFGLEDGLSGIMETIVFDSIISNSDRHQENWGFIVTPDRQEQRKIVEIRNMLSVKSRTSELVKRLSVSKAVYSPIYDSGCCLAREINESRVCQMLSDENMLNAFINRGKSEIRWRNEKSKINHFELIGELLREHHDDMAVIIKRAVDKYNKDEIMDVINNIDKNVPVKYRDDEALSIKRKELISILIDKRIKILEELLNG